jgi:hypothetical protein
MGSASGGRRWSGRLSERRPPTSRPPSRADHPAGRDPSASKPTRSHHRTEAAALRKATKDVLVSESCTRSHGTGTAASCGPRWARRGTPRPFWQVLNRPRNAGLRVYHSEIIGKAAWKPIVPEETWRALTTLLGDPSRRTGPGRQAPVAAVGDRPMRDRRLHSQCEDRQQTTSGTAPGGSSTAVAVAGILPGKPPKPTRSSRTWSSSGSVGPTPCPCSPRRATSTSPRCTTRPECCEHTKRLLHWRPPRVS